MNKRLSLLVISALLLVVCTLAIIQRPQGYHPAFEIELPSPSGGLTASLLFHGRPTLESCKSFHSNVSREIQSGCAQCRVKQSQCLIMLGDAQRKQLSTAALPVPSGRIGDGVVIFTSANPTLALRGCQASEKQGIFGQNPVRCFDANSPRPLAATPITLTGSPWALAVVLAAFAAAWLGGWFIVRYEHLHAHLSHDPVESGPQKYHSQPTPRIGGLAVMAGLLAAGGVMLFADPLLKSREFGFLLLAGIPAFGGGLLEDITKKVGVLERLLLTMLSGAVAAWLLGAILHRTDIPGFDQALLWLPFAIVFTSFCVGGIANAINIIDGYNGLVSGFSLLVLAALAYVAAQVGDQVVLTASLGMAGALFGFSIWNYPRGRMFLGDGGAYFLGFWLAELSVLLVARNPEVSPWFPVMLLCYPIFETFFSIYRKKFLQGRSPC